MSTARAHGPLAGVTVIGLEQAIAAPLCTRHLADLGARVIKIEQPGYGDSTRHYDTVVGGLSAHFTWLNHGKESAALDLRAPDDLAVLEAMLAGADVLVSNLGPGALDRLGLGVDELARRFPRLIIVDISGYGRGGPLDHKRAYDLLIQAEAGSCSITGTPGNPAKPGIPVADIGTALYSYSAILAALYDRERTGHGAVVPVAMLDVVSEMMGFALNQVLHADTEPVPVGMGSPMIAPYGAYATSDGQTAVLGTTSDREWRRMTDLMGCPELADDPRYLHNDDRVARRGEVDAVVEQWCATRTLAEIQDGADKAGIGNARLNGVRELAEHPQLRERDRWREIGTPSGRVPALLPPGTARDWPVVNGSVPALGAHTDAIRAEFAPTVEAGKT
ncbi:CaiB/BaiF CoA transferase family protein [Nocardia fluminea]|uniref:Crotonobetainyl-CoA:carnitine CoA-transferase CaiB-like acyl-CoA transferase n=1 Tax=Nocardia fluminea TaxID=134984 RepID=A0A2N3WXP0_9NOCA|nr:CaiB/BaiF CoA-transferase family protein [Nocardia fluminea]PKV98661.1 crotonobetainyl-CoA:carnitine CoA-transferase CaiB-like acyl-CoA transferase [Nocardia fluminea]